jgi:hypothetical protein
MGGATATATGTGGQMADSGAGAGAGTGGNGGGGGGDACLAGGETFYMSLEAFDGRAYGCGIANGYVGTVTLQGEVIASDGASITIDGCPSGQPCSPEVSTLTLAAPELAVFLPVGDYVTIEVSVDIGWGCAHRAQVTRLGTWSGSPNPFGSDPKLWLAAADGTAVPFDDAAFQITPIGLGCGVTGIDAFELTFYLPGDSGTTPLVLQQEETAAWSVSEPPAGAVWSVRNLRSFRTGNMNDDTNWGYWVAPADDGG